MEGNRSGGEVHGPVASGDWGGPLICLSSSSLTSLLISMITVTFTQCEFAGPARFALACSSEGTGIQWSCPRESWPIHRRWRWHVGKPANTRVAGCCRTR